MARILSRVGVATAIAVLFLLFAFPYGCDEAGGLSTWDRCSSFIGIPAIPIAQEVGLDSNWNITIYLVLAAAIGWLVFWVLKFTPLRRRVGLHEE